MFGEEKKNQVQSNSKVQDSIWLKVKNKTLYVSGCYAKDVCTLNGHSEREKTNNMFHW